MNEKKKTIWMHRHVIGRCMIEKMHGWMHRYMKGRCRGLIHTWMTGMLACTLG